MLDLSGHDINIINTGDLRGYIVGSDIVIGMDKIASLKAHTANSLLFDEGKKSSAETAANKYAKKMQDKLDKGKQLSDWNVGRQVQKNEAAIQNENDFAAAMSKIKPTEIRAELYNAKGQELNGIATDSGVSVSVNGNIDVPTAIKHEWLHMFEKLNPEAYKSYKASVLNAARETNNEAVENRIEFLKNEYNYNQTVAEDEIVAELTDGFNTKAIMRMAEGNNGLATKLAKAMRTAKREIRQAYTKGNYTSNTGLQITFEQLNNAEKAYIQGLEQARGNTAENGEVRYNITENADKIKADFGITNINDYIHVQRSVNQTLLNEGFFDDEGGRSKTVINDDSGMSVEITPKGIKETFGDKNFIGLSSKLKLAKIAVVRDLPRLIKNGRLTEDNVANRHNPNSSVKYAYITAETSIDGEPVTVNIDIRKSPQKNKFWVHSLDFEQKNSGVPSQTKSGVGSNASATNDIISENNGNVNTQNSGDIRYSVKEGNEYTPDKIARRLINENNANGRVYVKDVRKGIKELEGMVGDVFGDPTQVEGKYPEFEAKAQTIAEEIAYAARMENNAKKELYTELRDFLKGTRIKITNELRSDIPDFNNYRKSLMGTLVFSNDGVPMDVLYHDELQERFPQYFDETKHSSQSDQLIHLVDTLKNLKEYETEVSDKDYDA